MTDTPDPPADQPAHPGSAHPGLGAAGREVAHTLAAVRAHLDTLERSLDGAPGAAHLPTLPGWRRPARGEQRWPVELAVLAAIALQIALPERLTIGPSWLLPGLETLLALGLLAANPRRIDRRSQALRALSVGLIATITLANGWSVWELIRGILAGSLGKTAGPLLGSGASIYGTNIIVFALWYWEWDRGGPVERAEATRPYPDLLFPQMTQDHLAPDTWRPTFFDYLFVSYTNATAFSPTDTMPLSTWAKMMFLTQSGISLVTVALVVARAVNILS